MTATKIPTEEELLDQVLDEDVQHLSVFLRQFVNKRVHGFHSVILVVGLY